MKISMSDIAQKMASGPMTHVNLKLPTMLIAKIDAKATSELLNRSAWIRRTLFAATHSEAGKND